MRSFRSPQAAPNGPPRFTSSAGGPFFMTRRPEELVPVLHALVLDLPGAGEPCVVCGALSDFLDQEDGRSYCDEHVSAD